MAINNEVHVLIIVFLCKFNKNKLSRANYFMFFLAYYFPFCHVKFFNIISKYGLIQFTWNEKNYYYLQCKEISSWPGTHILLQICPFCIYVHNVNTVWIGQKVVRLFKARHTLVGHSNATPIKVKRFKSKLFRSQRRRRRSYKIQISCEQKYYSCFVNRSSV